MRIGIDARFYGTENTGLGRYTQNVLNNLFSQSDSVEYIVFVTPTYSSLKFPGNVKVIPVNVRHYTILEQFVMPYYVLRHKLDLLYTIHFNAPIFCPVPIIVTIHDLIKSHFSDKASSTHGSLMFTIKRLGYRIVMGAVIHKAKKIIVPSHAVKADIIEAYPKESSKKIIVVAEAPDPFFSAFGESMAVRDHHILFVGNAYPHKNLSTLLKAFLLLKKTGPWHLDIVSQKNSFLDSILAQFPDLIDYTLYQNVSDVTLRGLFASSAVFVTPSLMEGYGLPGLEALSLGVPVVASDIRVYREVYGNLVTYAKPLDPESYALSIIEAIKKPRTPYLFTRTWADVATAIRQAFV